ncbi:MAG: hypothetical protein H6620_06065 [Halobacteriovoraceae bacterium]|nr:hypothetical protein [Halobacteriovoraceae bacterium]
MIIKIFGSKAEGKTTIAELIAKTLKEKGIEVQNNDEAPESSPSLDERLQILGGPKGPLHCEIRTIPLKLETRPLYAREYAQGD